MKIKRLFMKEKLAQISDDLNNGKRKLKNLYWTYWVFLYPIKEK